MTDFIAWMDRIPDLAVYVGLAMGAALENVVPAIPADTFVALGGFLAGAGDLQAKWVWLATWASNVVGALAVYRLSRSHGASFFARGWGRHVLRPHQMQKVAGFYDRWGIAAIFLSRFLPGVRAVVPVFAGVTHQSWLRVAPPLVIASALWYGGLVRLGLFAGHNLGALEPLLGKLNSTLGLAALVVAGAVLIWWLRSRRDADE